MSDDHQHDIPADLEASFESMPEEEAADLRAMWALLGEVEPTADLDADPDAAWPRVREHVDAPASPPGADRSPVERARHVLSRRSVQVAAGLLLVVLAVGALVWQRPVRVTAAYGEQQSVSLPDGSTVHLNSGSTVAYRRGFARLPFWDADRRAVDLNGEAFFDVTDGERAFVVETNNARVEVLGTQFNVRSRRVGESEHTEVVLVSGRVRLAGRDDSASVTLEEGEAALVRGVTGPTAPRDTSVERVLAWRDGGFWVVDWPLRQVVDALERRYDVAIRVDADLPSYSVNLYYRSKTDVETILGDMCAAFNMKYEKTSGGYVLSRAAEQ